MDWSSTLDLLARELRSLAHHALHANAPVGTTRSRHRGTPVMTTRSANVAIVDDDPLFVEYLSTFLRSRGYETSVYPSGAALLQALPTSMPDAILLDVQMPNVTGLDTLRELRSSHPGTAVIVASGQQVPATIVDAVRLGALDYVVKGDG